MYFAVETLAKSSSTNDRLVSVQPSIFRNLMSYDSESPKAMGECGK